MKQQSSQFMQLWVISQPRSKQTRNTAREMSVYLCWCVKTWQEWGDINWLINRVTLMTHRDFCCAIFLRDLSCSSVMGCCWVVQQAAQPKSEQQPALICATSCGKRRVLIGQLLFTFRFVRRLWYAPCFSRCSIHRPVQMLHLRLHSLTKSPDIKLQQLK